MATDSSLARSGDARRSETTSTTSSSISGQRRRGPPPLVPFQPGPGPWNNVIPLRPLVPVLQPQPESQPEPAEKTHESKPVRRQGSEVGPDFDRLTGIRPANHELDSWSTAPRTMKIGRRVVIPNGGTSSVSKYAGKHFGQWIKRLFKEDLPVLALGTGAALFGAFALAGGLPDPRVASRFDILRTALVAAVAEEGVLFPLAAAVTSIRQHKLHGIKSLRAIGRGLHGTATRMAGLVTAKSLLGVTLHASMIAAGVVVASALPVGAAGAWALGITTGNTFATGVMLCAADVIERGVRWLGRKMKRVIPFANEVSKKAAERENSRVKSAEWPSGRGEGRDVSRQRGDWLDKQEWRAINEALRIFDGVGGGRKNRGAQEVEPYDAMPAMRRRLSDYRVSIYSLMLAAKEVMKENEFKQRLTARDSIARKIAATVTENETAKVTEEQKLADKELYHRTRADLEAWKEGNPEDNPFVRELSVLQKEHDFLMDLAKDVISLGEYGGRHISAAVKVSALRDSDWGESVLDRFSPSNLFTKPGISFDVLAGPTALVREPLLAS